MQEGAEFFLISDVIMLTKCSGVLLDELHLFLVSLATYDRMLITD